MKPLWVCELGQVDYATALRLQETLVRARHQGRLPDCLLLLEHPPVYTIGRGGGWENLRVPLSMLRDQGIAVCEVNRGGNITYHGPGQVVGYPILDLTLHRQDARWYLRTLEEVLIEVLQSFNLPAQRRPGFTGVWCEGAKIASIGIAIRHWVTMHGWALNLDLDLRPFQWIHPCGLRDAQVTSMAQLMGKAPVQPKVRRLLAEVFAERFHREVVHIDPEMLPEYSRLSALQAHLATA